jgi:two-component system, NarL family, nitrate/nitrite response regulator NarL
MNTTSNVSKHAAESGRLAHRGRDAEEVSPSAVSRQDALEPQNAPVRIILADSEAIFRVGMARIFSVESDLDVVAQADNLPQTISVVAETQADVILFEAGLSPMPAEAVSEVARRALPGAKLILVAQRTGEQETVDYLRRGVRGIITRAVSPDLLVRCVRKVAAGETWLDKQGVNWVIEAYRSQALQGAAPKQQLRLSEKEMLIISGVTQGLKNKDIAREVGTTEQVVKNYLRKIYDKLLVTDRLELALYSIHHRLLDGYVPRPGREAGRGVGDPGKAAEIPRAAIASAPAGDRVPSHQPQQPKHDSNSNDR